MSTQIHIAHVIPAVTIGGLSRHLNAAARLEPARFKSTAISLFDRDSADVVAHLPMAYMPLSFSPSVYEQEVLIRDALIGAFEAIEPQLVHSYHFYSDIYAVPAAASLGIPLVRSVHGITQTQPKYLEGLKPVRYDWAEGEIARELGLDVNVVRTLVVSEELRRRLVGYGFASSKIETVYVGVDTETFDIARVGAAARALTEQLGLDERLRIGLVGRLEPVKNPLLMVSVIERCRVAGLSLSVLVAGGGILKDDVKRSLTALEGPQIAVHFLPETSHVAAVLAAIDVLLVTSESEGLPYVILEAMALKKVVIATNVGGIPEAIDNGRNGLLCQCGDVEALAAALIDVARNPSIRAELGSAARRTVETRFSLGADLERRSMFYERALALGRESPDMS